MKQIENICADILPNTALFYLTCAMRFIATLDFNFHIMRFFKFLFFGIPSNS